MTTVISASLLTWTIVNSVIANSYNATYSPCDVDIFFKSRSIFVISSPLAGVPPEHSCYETGKMSRIKSPKFDTVTSATAVVCFILL